VRVNGREHAIARCNVREMLGRLDIGERGVAVALNGTIVPRSEWDRTFVDENDMVEVVTAAAGG